MVSFLLAQCYTCGPGLHPIAAKATGVTITTMKLKIQFAVVEMAFAGARIDRGVISAGYSLDTRYQSC